MKFAPLFALILMSLTASAHAKCLTDNGPVEIQGVITTRAVYIPPGEFGWVPENGFIEYDVLVTPKPVCVQLTVEGETPSTEYFETNVIQLGAPKIAKNAKDSGVNVSVKGTLFSRHTGHHFQDVLINAESISIQ